MNARLFVLLALFFSMPTASAETVAETNCAGKTCFNIGYSPFFQRPRALAMLKDLYDPILAGMPLPVIVGTTANHCDYLDRLKAYHYDVVSLPLAWAAYAANELGYLPLLSSDSHYEVVLLSRNTAPVRELSQLRGLRLGIQLNTHTSIGLLRRALERDHPGLYETLHIRSDEWEDLLVLKLLRDEVDAIISPGVAYQKMSQEIRDKLTVLTLPSPLPLYLVLGNPKTDPRLLQRYKELSLAQKTLSSQQFLAVVFRPAMPQDIDIIDEYFGSEEPSVRCTLSGEE